MKTLNKVTFITDIPWHYTVDTVIFMEESYSKIFNNILMKCFYYKKANLNNVYHTTVYQT